MRLSRNEIAKYRNAKTKVEKNRILMELCKKYNYDSSRSWIDEDGLWCTAGLCPNSESPNHGDRN